MPWTRPLPHTFRLWHYIITSTCYYQHFLVRWQAEDQLSPPACMSGRTHEDTDDAQYRPKGAFLPHSPLPLSLSPGAVVGGNASTCWPGHNECEGAGLTLIASFLRDVINSRWLSCLIDDGGNSRVLRRSATLPSSRAGEARPPVPRK